MAIGSDVVGGMMELFDKVMSVKGLSTLKGGGWKTLDPEDVQLLEKSPEAQQHHLTADWMDKVLGKSFPEVKKVYPAGEKILKPELKSKSVAFKAGTEPNLSPETKKLLGKIDQPKSVAFKQQQQFEKTQPGQPIVPKKSVAFKDPQITSTLNLPPGNAQNPILARDPALPMDEASRMARAKAGGFTTPAFRGVSRPSRQSPEPSPSYGYYSAESKGKNPAELAELYAMEFHSGKHGTPSIMPLLLNTQDYLVYNAKEKMWNDVNDKAIKMARDQGKKGVVMQNVWDEPYGKGKTKQSATVYITLDTATARSKTGAAFDPKKYSINDLLASGRAFVVPPKLLQSVQSGTIGREPTELDKDAAGMEVPGVGLFPKEAPSSFPGKGMVQDLWEGFFAPGEAQKGKFAVQPEKAGMLSEEDVERARMAQEAEASAAGKTAMLGMTGGIAGVEKGAAGIFGGKLFAKPGAAQTAKTVLNPGKDLIRATSDDLFRLRNWVTADKTELAQHLDTMPPEFKTPVMQEKFYRKLEDPKEVLSPGEEAVFNKYILPMRDEIQKLSQVAGKYGMPLEDNEWVHRVVKGQEPLPQEGAHAVPQLGTRSLPRKTSAMMPRSLYVLEHEGTGRRIVVSQSDHEPGVLTVWQKGKGQKGKWGDELKLGNPVISGGQKFTVKHARTSELEAETPFRYQKSAAVNLGDALVKMRATVRNIEYLDRLTKSPDWLKWATKNPHAPAGWSTPHIPQLKDWKVHPKMVAPFNDFYQPGIVNAEGALEPLRRLNRWSVGTLFWNPIPHIENVAGHWAVARGWEWAKPTGYYNLFTEGARALKAVRAMDNDYKDLLKHGSALISGGVRNADFYGVLAKKFGLEIERNPGPWMKMANQLGMGLPDLVKSWYAASNRVMWQANDVFMMQRVFELERRGMSRLDAIKSAEKHIPNYRVPPEVLGSRAFSMAMQDPLVTAFGRYHYGVWNSYTNMVKDLVGPKATKEERFEAVGNMLALGGLVFGVYPALSWGLQQLTGDEDIKKLPRGPASIPSALYSALTDGEKQWYDIIGNSITLAPPFKELGEQLFDRDFFTGQNIEEPGEEDKWVRGAQRIEHMAGSIMAPYAQANALTKSFDEKGVPREILKHVVGTQDLTEQQQRGKRVAERIARRKARKREKQPRGLIERGVGYFTE